MRTLASESVTRSRGGDVSAAGVATDDPRGAGSTSELATMNAASTVTASGCLIFDRTFELLAPKAEGTYREPLFTTKSQNADLTRFPGGDRFAPERFSLPWATCAIAVAARMSLSSIALPHSHESKTLTPGDARLKTGFADAYPASRTSIKAALKKVNDLR